MLRPRVEPSCIARIITLQICERRLGALGLGCVCISDTSPGLQVPR